MVRFGLKLWSTNHELFPDARRAVESGHADFVELYAVPGKTDVAVLTWELDGVPTAVHAPHENHGFDLHTLTEAQARQFKTEVSGLADALHATVIVVHAGVGSGGSRFADNFHRLADPRIVLENMPKDALDGGTCFGYTHEQLRFLQGLSGRLCIDFGHAIKSATAQGIEYHRFLSDILEQFRPRYFHLADGDPKTGKDEHRSLGDGNYDLKWIAERLAALGKQEDVSVVLEVPKIGSGLSNDLANIQGLRSLGNA
jgi:sugar phosphate isomerase/epimerase